MTAITPLSGIVVTTYTFDAANRLTDQVRSDDRAYTYTWSSRNQMLSEWTEGAAVREFSYDAAGRMIEATVFTLTTRFTYNGLGARVAVEVVGQETTTFTLDYAARNRILAEATPTGAVHYLYGRDCLGELRDDEWLYYLNDATGYVRQGVDDQEQVMSGWLFDPDGVVLEGPEGPVSHLVCGGVYDWSTGLIYKDGRYFDPMLGIWLALAPLVVVQSWKGRKKRRGFPWYVLVLLVGMSGTLIACGEGGTLTPADLTETACVELPQLERLDVVLQTPSIAHDEHGPRKNSEEYYVTLGPSDYGQRIGALITGEVSGHKGGSLEFVQNANTRGLWTFADGSQYGTVGSDDTHGPSGWFRDGPDPLPSWDPDNRSAGANSPCTSGTSCVRQTSDVPSSSLSLGNERGSPLIQLHSESSIRTYLLWRPISCARIVLGVVEWSWMVVAVQSDIDTGESWSISQWISDPLPGEPKAGVAISDDTPDDLARPVFSPTIDDILIEQLTDPRP
jgi:YD repeat-containing protein